MVEPPSETFTGVTVVVFEVETVTVPPTLGPEEGAVTNKGRVSRLLLAIGKKPAAFPSATVAAS